MPLGRRLLGRWLLALIATMALAAAASGCAVTRPPPPPPEPTPTPIPPIRVGLTADSPPFSFRQGQDGRLVGIELDLASYLGHALGKPIRVYAMAWDELIPALSNHEIDVIMAGMTITRLRQLRVAFGEPYLESGLAVLVRRSDTDRFRSPSAVLRAAQQIGVTKGTTGEKYVREHYREGQIFSYASNASAVADLGERRIDAFVSDLPIVAWYASENEGSLAPLVRPLLTRESIAWGFRPTDGVLRDRANRALERWKRDGTLSGVLLRWLPRWGEERGGS